MTTKHIWVVEGEHAMHCNGCAQTVEYSLSRLQGVQSVKANYPTQRVEVEVSNPETIEQIVTELESLGYKAREITNGDNTDN